MVIGRAVASSGPFAFARAFMCNLAAVLEAECTVAGFAAEGKEVQQAAVFELAVAADGFEVCVCHLGVGFLL